MSTKVKADFSDDDVDIRSLRPMLAEVLQAVKDSHIAIYDKQTIMQRLLEARLGCSTVYGSTSTPLMAYDQSCRSEPISATTPLRLSTSSGCLDNAGVLESNNHVGNYSSQMEEQTDGFHDRCDSLDMSRVSTIKPYKDTSLSRLKTDNLMDVMELLRSGEVVFVLREFIKTSRFDFVMGLVICLHSIYIGIQINESIASPQPIATPLDYIFLSIYLFELFLRCWAFGTKQAMSISWNIFDLLLVMAGAVYLFFIVPVSHFLNFGRGAQFLQQITILRLIRLLRLVRALRLLQQFRILWGLVNGLLHALTAILSTMALLCLLLYIYACVGIEMITKNADLQSMADSDGNLRNILDTYFGSLPVLMLTLIRFTTMDSIGAIYEPIVNRKPWMVCYIICLLLVISITIMNLITAVLVEHSLKMAKNDSELEHHQLRKTVKKLKPIIEELFTKLDTNADGLLTLSEVTRANVALPPEISHIVSPESLLDLFEALDEDQSGSVDKDEFVDGVINLALSAVPLEIMKVLHYLRAQKDTLRKVDKRSAKIKSLVEVFHSPAYMQDFLRNGMLQQSFQLRDISRDSREVPDADFMGDLAAERSTDAVPNMYTKAKVFPSVQTPIALSPASPQSPRLV